MTGAPEQAPPPHIEAARQLFARPCTLLVSAGRLDEVPATRLAEVAFAGRSNVGKSSLINALTGRKALAETSQTPGRTRRLHFYDLGGRLSLVDLPGYGYAEASKERVAAWGKLVDAYLVGRPTLRRAFVLVDARHGLKAVDERVMSMLDRAAVSYQIVLTKADKVKAAALAVTRDRVGAALPEHTAAHPEVLATSAWSADGIPELRAVIAGLADWAGDTAHGAAAP